MISFPRNKQLQKHLVFNYNFHGHSNCFCKQKLPQFSSSWDNCRCFPAYSNAPFSSTFIHHKSNIAQSFLNANAHDF